MTDITQKPNAAQILLANFCLPPPPDPDTIPETITHITLTSDIPPTAYAEHVATPISPNAIHPGAIPKSIESLTLELFSLGYPAGFLGRLGEVLRGRLTALTVYSSLLDGAGEGSRADAARFMRGVLTGSSAGPENQGNNGQGGGGNGGGDGLAELHLLDTFCRRGFIASLGTILNENTPPETARLRLLEVSYTYRGHSDADFLSRIPGDELPSLLTPSLVAVSLHLSPRPEGTTGLDGLPDDPADVDEDGKRIAGEKPQGMIPFGTRFSGTKLLIEKLAGEETSDKETGGEQTGSTKLKMLDCTLYTLTLDNLARVLRSQTQLAVLLASVLVRTEAQSKRWLLDTLQTGNETLEMVEIVGTPGDEDEFDEQNSSFDLFYGIFPDAADMAALSVALPRLDSFTMNILCAPRFGAVRWERNDGQWVGGIVEN